MKEIEQVNEETNLIRGKIIGKNWSGKTSLIYTLFGFKCKKAKPTK